MVVLNRVQEPLSGSRRLQEVTTTRTTLWESALETATLVVMPALTDGAAGAGVQAIERGIPMVTSDDSDLGAYLAEWVDRLAEAGRSLVRRTLDEEPEPTTWADKILGVLKDPQAAFEHANELRVRLVEERPWRVVAVNSWVRWVVNLRIS